MAGTVPKSVVQDLTDRVSLLGDSFKANGKFEEFSWHKLMKEIQGLEKTDFVSSCLLLKSVMFWIKGDLEKVTPLLDMYSRTYGPDVYWYLTRASMAQMFGDVSLVTEMLDSGYPVGNIYHLTKVVDVCANSGFFRSAFQALRDIEAIDSRYANKLAGDFRFVLSSARYLIDNSIDDLEVARRIVAATNLIHRKGNILATYRVFCNEVGIIYEVIVDADIERLVDINISIYEELACRFDNSFSDHISIGVAPKE